MNKTQRSAQEGASLSLPSRNGSASQFDVDRALITVASYLQSCGVKHPDLVHDQSHRIIDASVSVNDDGHSSQQVIHRCLKIAIESIEQVHDRLLTMACEIDQRTGRKSSPQCVVSLSRLIANPAIARDAISMRRPEPGDSMSEQEISMAVDRIRDNAATVLPQRKHRPMRECDAPKLVGALRGSWWMQIAASIMVACGLSRMLHGLENDSTSLSDG